MSTTLKPQKSTFNLLYLDYSENLFNSTITYIHYNNAITKSHLYITSHSLIIEPDDATLPLTKLYYNNHFQLKSYLIKDLSRLYKENKNLFITPKINKPMMSLSKPQTERQLLYKSKNSYSRRYASIVQSTNTLPSHSKTNATINVINFKQMLQNALDNNTIENTNIKLNDSQFINSNLNIYLNDLCAYCDYSMYKVGKVLRFFHHIYHKKYVNSTNSNKSYAVMIVKCEKIKKMYRNRFTEENVEANRTCLIVIEETKQKLDTFLNDLTVFTETMCLSEDNINEGIDNIVTARKIEELKALYSYKRKDDSYESKSNNIIDSNSKEVTFYSVCMKVNAEKCRNGLFVIHLYDQNKNDYLCEFIPVNNSLSQKSTKFYLNEIRLFLSFRFLYRYKALNLFFYSQRKSKIFDFEAQEDFTYVFNFFTEHCKKSDTRFYDIKYHTNLWIDGLMTNYDYLMYLNTIASRSFNDLSQYPILPWTIKNFKDKSIDLNNANSYRDLSKSMGALNPKRLKVYNEKYLETNYHFRNFISYPYVVYFYLMRTNPLFYLRYQGGAFGPSDRMFVSVQDCWNVTYNNVGLDIKELIPEFYNSESNGEFLKNIFNIDFGTTQTGYVVNDVILPPWAKSPKDFIMTMRAALESEVVSNSLHLWIDLIFGYKQKGKNAIESNNVYYYLRYENSIFDIDEKDDDQRQSDLDDIIECGQVPIQLFSEAHPKKRSRVILNELNDLILNNANKKGIEIYKQKRERMIIEKKYEKERRDKEVQTDKIKRIIKEKEKSYNETLKQISDERQKKEIEFKAYVASLNKIKEDNENNFNIYQKNKEKILEEWVKNIKNKYNVQIKNMFQNDKSLYQYLKGLEMSLSKYEERKEQFEKIEEILEKKEEEIISENKELHKELNQKGNIYRSFPISIKNKVNNQSSNLKC